jgi:predicted nuclease with TOPRIM domain
MAPTPPSPFWQEVKAQAIAGTMVVVAAGTLGGLGYLIHTVPNKLDEVLSNQTQFKGRIDKLESEVDQHSERLIRLEANR